MARRQSNAGSTAPFYEDFLPKSELIEEQRAHLLRIHLPDFSKEQIRVIYIDSTRTVRVQGERPLGNNKWSRFNRTFTVPQNCIVDKIHGKFQEGILTITIPKQIITPPQPAAAPKEKEPSSAPAPPPKEPASVTAPPPKEPFPVAAPPPKVPPSVAAPPPKEPSPAEVPPSKEPSPAEVPPSKEPSSVAAPPPPPKVPSPEAAPPSPPKVPSPVAAPPPPPPPAKVPAPPPKPAVPAQLPQGETTDSQTKDKEKKVDTSSPSKVPYESQSQKQDEARPLLETMKKTEEQRSAESKAERIKKSDETAEIPAWKSPEKKGDVVGEKGKVKEETSFIEKAKEMKNVAVATMKTALEKKEDRQLIVSVGMAFLVIVAVGAYVTYKIRSSAKSKD